MPALAPPGPGDRSQSVGVFGWGGIDYAMLVKIYGQSPGGQRRYSPPEILGAEKHRVMGEPNPAKVSTSYAERQNLTMLTCPQWRYHFLC